MGNNNILFKTDLTRLQQNHLKEYQELLKRLLVVTKMKEKKFKLLYYQNTRSLRTKLNKFLFSSACCHCDVLCITESWLHTFISDGELVDNNYIIFRKDRDASTSVYERGRGVFIAIELSGTAESIPLNDSGLENFVVKIKGFGNDIHSRVIFGDYNICSSLPQLECDFLLHT